jgi:PAS domain S-box-containing protein
MQSHPIRVLLVDDDEDDYTVIRDLLSGLSSIEFILKWVSDYGAALDAILSSEFDVCLLDYLLKGRNGLELMQEAVSRGAMTPIVFLTGHGGYDQDLEAMSKGAAGWFTKDELSATLLERAIRHAMERQRKRVELIKAKRVIQALSECNHAVIHIEDELELLRAICRIVVDVGGYKMAWVGYAEEDRDQTVTPVAQYGYDKDYLETVKVTWKDAERGRGPTGTCIRTGFPSIIRSVGSQAEAAPWRVEALKRGYASVIGLPLLLDGRTLGALTIYASETDAFDTEEVQFLVKLSSNLSYGIGVLRLRKARMQAEESLKEANLDLERRVEERTAELAKINAELRGEVEERKQAEEALKEGERKFRAIFDQTFQFMGLLTIDGRLLEANRTALQFSGVQESDVIGKPFWETPWWIHSTELQETLCAGVKKAAAGEVVRFEPTHFSADGSLHCMDFSLKPIMDAAGGVAFLIAEARDITERKRAEEALQQSEREKAILNQIANVFLTIPDEKIYEEVLAVILKTLKCRYGVFGYIGDSGDLIIPSMTKEIWSDCQVEGKSIVFPRHLWGDSLWGKAIKEKKSFSSDGPFQTPEGHLPIYNFLTVPVVFADKTIGLASVANKDGGFSVEDKTILERIAGNISPILSTRFQRDKQELERKRAEEALRESEEKYRVLFEGSTHGILAVDIETKRFVFANPSICHMLGYSENELLDLDIEDIQPKDSLNLVLSELESQLLEEKKLSSTLPCLRKDGTVFFADIAGTFTSIHGRKLAVGFFSDVTVRKLAEDALKESEQQLANIIDFLPDATLVINSEGKVIAWNKAIEEMTGVKASDMLGKGNYEYALPFYGERRPILIDLALKPREEILSKYTSTARRGNGIVGEAYMPALRAGKTYLYGTASILRDSSGNIVGAIESIRDITERRRVEEALRETEVRLKIAMDLAKLVQWEYDVKTGMFSFDEQFYALYGTTSQHEGGPLMTAETYARKFIPPEESYVVAEAIAKTLASNDPNFTDQLEHRIVRADGEERHIIVRYEVVCDQTGRVVKTRGVNQDITERKRAEEALRASEQRLADIIDFLPDATFAINSEGIVIAWNHAIEEMTGVPRESMIGKGNLEYSLPFYGNRRSLLIDLVFASEEEIRRDYGPISRIGDTIVAEAFVAGTYGGKGAYLWGTSTALYDKSGKVIGAIESIRDITERKQAEDALREGEERFSRFFRSTPVGTSITRLSDGQCVDINDAFLGSFGYTREEVIGQNPLELGIWADPEDRGRMVEILQEQGRIQDFETQFRRKSGEIRDVLVSAELIEVAGQQYILGLAHDITERKRIEEELRENQSRLELALQSAHMGVWHWDLIKDKRFFDDQVCHLLGIAPGKFTGTADGFFNVVHPDDREVLKAALARTIEQDVPYETEYRAVWPDGSLHYIIARAKLFRDETGQRVRLNGLIWDITERKRADEEKEKLETQLRQSQKVEAIGMLAGGIAHDFNNILQPIIGYTEMGLNELPPSSPQRKSLEQVLNASIRAKGLIRQILAVSRSAQEQQRIPTDISSIIKEALKLLRSSLPTSIEMRQKIRKGVALADPTQIHQVLMNLCTNAAHAMDDKGILEVRLSPVDLSESDLADQSIFDLKPGPYLRLTVSDTGCGMDGKTLERIFDPYFTTKEVGKGSGLGLAVVSGIVKRHEGAITVRSEPGKGTTFSVYIPRVDVQSEATMQVEDLPPHGSERILLVDDESAVTGVGTELLESLGYKVTSRTDSLNALEVFRSSPFEFDLVITDYTMPKLTGLDFAREVLRLRPDIPILLCTGFSEKITPDSVKKLGMGLLMKPYGMREISEAVRKILDARRGG